MGVVGDSLFVECDGAHEVALLLARATATAKTAGTITLVLRLTPRGRLLSNEVFQRFLLDRSVVAPQREQSG